MSAIAVFTGNIKGTVYFITRNDNVDININLTGLNKNSSHGFHVHTYGDISDGHNSACSHFNPYNKTHGCPGMENRHVGDLGNIKTDMYGNANYKTNDNVISLDPKNDSCIIGRMLIIHENEDDCGLGTGDKKAESLKSGNSGKRIAYAIIGYAKNC